MINKYEKRIIEDINKIHIGSYYDVDNIHKYPKELATQILQKLIEWACQPQNETLILLARKKIDEINKDWLKYCLLDVARECIDFSDYWEYRRFIELIVCVIPELKAQALKMCEDSEDEDIREVLEDYKDA